MWIRFRDERSDREVNFHFQGGIASFVRHLNKDREVVHPPAHLHRANQQRHHHRGRHPVQRRLLRVHLQLRQQHQHHRRRHPPHRLPHRPDPRPQRLRPQAEDPQGRRPNLTGDDVREGLTAVISVKLPEPQFEGQTKASLGNAEIKGQVESAVAEELSPLPGGEPPGRPPHHREVPHRRPGPRGRPQGPRPGHPQGRPGRHDAPRQAGRLLGA